MIKAKREHLSIKTKLEFYALILATVLFAMGAMSALFVAVGAAPLKESDPIWRLIAQITAGLGTIFFAGFIYIAWQRFAHWGYVDAIVKHGQELEREHGQS